MNNTIEIIIRNVTTYIDSQKIVPTEEHILKLVNAYSVVPGLNLTNEEKEIAIKEIFSRMKIKMDVGSFIKDLNHKPWYNNAKKDIEGEFWNRYRSYLLDGKNFAIETVNAIDRSTDIMMDMLGNPNQTSSFSCRGLVIGDVQSGKTSTYTALINKAADAGYKVIILLTGTIEKLRQQTQSRLDEGFVGLDSTGFVNNRNKIDVGVGKINGSFSACSVTSTIGDFNQKTASQLNITLKNISDPVIFVLKKNKSVLTKLEKWLKVYNAVDGKISYPMLMIDDEADNASVNTKKEDQDPTAINAGIRKLLTLFTHSTYVAFTATPYANIFINPDSDDDMLKDDLFPRDFIYALDAPTNYIGPDSVFLETGKYHYMLNENDDCEDILPEKHRKDAEFEKIPNSLKAAICSFFISNAIRDLRGHENTHRSMLINISRFIDVQEKIRIKVDDFVREYQRQYKLYGKMGALGESHSAIQYTKKIYESQFLNKEIEDKENVFSWPVIQEKLSESCAPIVVRTVNGKNSKVNLNYDDNSELGLRIIAVGGFSLSRGLTLEGLSTSYYYRNSKMYDTLMQMGRWFGYRNHYADLCRIWMSEQSQDWYENITIAQDELKQEVKKMMNAKRTPKEFGLGVRNDDNALLVTAVNKMRNAKEYTMSISLCGHVVETSYLPLSEKINRKNNETIYNWLNCLNENGYKYVQDKKINGKTYSLDQKNHKQILDINKKFIIDLLSEFKVSNYNFNFQPENIIDMIQDDNEGSFNEWDLIIADNSKNNREKITSDLSVGPIKRSYIINKEKKYIQMSGSKSRLGSVNYAKGGLTKEEAGKIEKIARSYKPTTVEKINYNQNDYFSTGFKRNPLLIIYPVSLLNDGKKQIEHKELVENYGNLVFGLAIGFPDIEGKGKKIYKYKINLVKWKEILGIDDDYEEEIVDEDN